LRISPETSCVAGPESPDIGYPDIGPDIEPDIGYAVYDDIGDMMTRYRVAPDIGVNIGVNVTRSSANWGVLRMAILSHGTISVIITVT
jgi:hypothetical protein